MKTMKAALQVTALKLCLVTLACGQAPETKGADISATAPSATTPAAQASDELSNWIHVPGGQLVHPSCVHALPQGAKITRTHDIVVNGSVVAHHDACQYAAIDTRSPSGAAVDSPERAGINAMNIGGTAPLPYLISGVLAYSYYESANGSAIASWSDVGETANAGTWTVPSAPTTNHGQAIFMGNGAGYINGGEWVLQNVLQYGTAQMGATVVVPPVGGEPIQTPTPWGGQYWQIESWASDSTTGNVYMSYPLPVDALDTIVASGYATKTAGNWQLGIADFNIAARTSTSNDSTGLLVDVGTQEFTDVFAGDIEVYGVTECSDLPASVATIFTPPFVALVGETVTPALESTVQTWTAKTNVADNALGTGCTFASSITSSGGTSITY